MPAPTGLIGSDRHERGSLEANSSCPWSLLTTILAAARPFPLECQFLMMGNLSGQTPSWRSPRVLRRVALADNGDGSSDSLSRDRLTSQFVFDHRKLPWPRPQDRIVLIAPQAHAGAVPIRISCRSTTSMPAGSESAGPSRRRLAKGLIPPCSGIWRGGNSCCDCTE